MADDQYKLRRVESNNNNNNGATASAANGKSPATNPSGDEAAVEDIIVTKDAPPASASADDMDTSPTTDAPPKPTDATTSDEMTELRNTILDLKTRLTLAESSASEAQSALTQGRLAYAALDAKHQQFVEANVAFTHWRDDMERQRASWAEANAKFAKRHEENKAAKANLEAKYAAVVMDLEEVKERYGATKRELMRVTGVMERSVSPPLPSAIRNAGQVGDGGGVGGGGVGGKGKKGSGVAGSKASIRGVERDQQHQAAYAHLAPQHHFVRRAGLYPTTLVEQSVLRERLTSDMFTLSQKVLEERANRAEEARQMAERRIFELESQLATRAQ